MVWSGYGVVWLIIVGIGTVLNSVLLGKALVDRAWWWVVAHGVTLFIYAYVWTACIERWLSTRGTNDDE